MSDQYPGAAGFVQQFGADKPAVTTREVNNQTIREFTIKALGSQKLIKVTLWPEFAGTEINAGDFVAVEGKMTVNEKNGVTYFNLSASKLAKGVSCAKADRQVVNSTSTTSESSPF